MKKSYSPWLEILIVVLAGVLIWLLGYPQYEENIEINKRYQVRVNMHTLRAAIENYAAYNKGKFPRSSEEFKEFFSTPSNPYSNKSINPKDIIIFQFDSKEEPKEQSPDSKNGRIRGTAGGLAYGYFIAEEDSFPSAYGILGFDTQGRPLAEKLPSGETKVFVLYE